MSGRMRDEMMWSLHLMGGWSMGVASNVRFLMAGLRLVSGTNCVCVVWVCGVCVCVGGVWVCVHSLHLFGSKTVSVSPWQPG